MGELIDFGEAKAKILGKTTNQETAAVSADLSDALEVFSFSRLSKEERVERTIRQALFNAGYDTEDTFKIKSLTNILSEQLPADVFPKPLPKVTRA